MKEITMTELKERGMKQGDIVFLENKHNSGFNGWYLMIDELRGVGLNTPIRWAWSSNVLEEDSFNKKTKIILIEDMEQFNFPYKISMFLRDFDADLIDDIVTEILEEHKYISACHFGESKSYMWRVPESMKSVELKQGDVVVVDTCKGKQLVEIRQVWTSPREIAYKDVIRKVKV